MLKHHRSSKNECIATDWRGRATAFWKEDTVQRPHDSSNIREPCGNDDLEKEGKLDKFELMREATNVSVDVLNENRMITDMVHERFYKEAGMYLIIVYYFLFVLFKS